MAPVAFSADEQGHGLLGHYQYVRYGSWVILGRRTEAVSPGISPARGGVLTPVVFSADEQGQ